MTESASDAMTHANDHAMTAPLDGRSAIHDSRGRVHPNTRTHVRVQVRLFRGRRTAHHGRATDVESRVVASTSVEGVCAKLKSSGEKRVEKRVEFASNSRRIRVEFDRPRRSFARFIPVACRRFGRFRATFLSPSRAMSACGRPRTRVRVGNRALKLCALAFACVLVLGVANSSVFTRSRVTSRERAFVVTTCGILTASWVDARVANALMIKANVDAATSTRAARARSFAASCDVIHAVKLTSPTIAERGGYCARYEDTNARARFRSWTTSGRRRDFVNESASATTTRGEVAKAEEMSTRERAGEKVLWFKALTRVLATPRAVYASVTADVVKHQLYVGEDARLSSIGNLAMFGILANFVREGASAASSDATQSGFNYSSALWPNAGEAARVGAERLRRDPSVRRRAILLLEDDANIDFERFASKIDGLMRALPRGWDVLALDSHPEFCGVARRWPLSASASGKRNGVELHRAYTTFSRTTALVVSWQGALRILRRLPSSLVIDMFLARLLRLGALRIYVSCDGIVRQQNSAIPSITNG